MNNTISPPGLAGPAAASPAVPPPASPAPSAASDPLPESPVSPAPVARQPGETPRAFGAFRAWYGLGQRRSLAAVARALGEKPGTVRNWSVKYAWPERLLACQTGLLAARLNAEAALERRQLADWEARSRDFRERKWAASQQLLAASSSCLENFGDRALEKATLAQVARALQISTRLAAEALRGDSLPDEPAASSLPSDLEAALAKAYSQPPDPPAPAPAAATPATNPLP